MSFFQQFLENEEGENKLSSFGRLMSTAFCKISLGKNTWHRVAWYDDNSGERTHEVGKKEPDGLCLYDMSGNVYEWCADWYDSDAYSEHSRDNPIYDSGGDYRVGRGGGWGYNPAYVRCADRYCYSPGYTYSGLGFRLLRTD